jgi:hypothetical protein
VTTGPAEHQKDLLKVPARQKDLPIPDTENQLLSRNKVTDPNEPIRIVKVATRKNRFRHAANHIPADRRAMTVRRKAPIAIGATGDSLLKESHTAREALRVMAMIVRKKAPIAIGVIRIQPATENHILQGNHQASAMIVRKKAPIAIGVIRIQLATGNHTHPGNHQASAMIVRKGASIKNQPGIENDILQGNHRTLETIGKKEASIRKALATVRKEISRASAQATASLAANPALKATKEAVKGLTVSHSNLMKDRSTDVRKERKLLKKF